MTRAEAAKLHQGVKNALLRWRVTLRDLRDAKTAAQEHATVDNMTALHVARASLLGAEQDLLDWLRPSEE